MPATAIVTPYGETVHRDFAVYGVDVDTAVDVALFTIRDKHEQVWLWKVLKPTIEDDTVMFSLDISHTEAEKLPKGSYKYGLTLYRDPVYLNDDPKMYPVDGTVDVLVWRKPYNVKESVAREAGL